MRIDNAVIPAAVPLERCTNCRDHPASGWRGFCDRCEAQVRMDMIRHEQKQLEQEEQMLREEAEREGWI
jgi:hypothetical protein